MLSMTEQRQDPISMVNLDENRGKASRIGNQGSSCMQRAWKDSSKLYLRPHGGHDGRALLLLQPPFRLPGRVQRLGCAAAVTIAPVAIAILTPALIRTHVR